MFCLDRWKQRTIDKVATFLFLSALGTCLVMICAAMYLLILSKPQFGCPLSSKLNCQGKDRCSTCNIFNTTTNDIVRFHQELLNNKDLLQCSADVIFPAEEGRDSCAIDCGDSVLNCVYKGFRSFNIGAVCQACLDLEVQLIVQFAVSIMLFPLGVLFMMCNLLAWRSVPPDDIQLPRQPESNALSHRHDYPSETRRHEVAAPSLSSSTLETIQKLETTLKGLSTLNQFVKYLAQTVVFFLILIFSNPTCDPTSSSGSLSSARLTASCQPKVDINSELFVMGCCAIVFLVLLIFDFIVIRRNKLQHFAEPISLVVVSTCVILMIICSAQLVQVLNSKIRFVCADRERILSLGNSEIELRNYFCPVTRPECSACETKIPSSAKIVASSIVLDMLFVIFGAIGYAYNNIGVHVESLSLKMVEIKSS